jgi:cytosine/creatinine deaminase
MAGPGDLAAQGDRLVSQLDLTIRNVRLADGRGPLDIGVMGTKIAAMEPNLPPGVEDYEFGGRLALPGLVETHLHLDKACILDRCHAGADLAAAIASVSAAKAGFTEEDVAERAGRVLKKCIGQGTMHIRTHVEVDPVVGMRGFEGVRAAAREHEWGVDVEICVFPQEGMTNYPGVEELVIEGLKRGAKVIGGAPYVDADPHGQIDRIFGIARDFDVDIDLHLDFSLNADELDADYVCRKTDEFGWGGRVAIGHVSKLSALPPERFDAAAKRLADAGVAVTVLPATDLFLMGRGHTHNVPRGIAPAHRLVAAGVNCSISTNNVLNPFTPFGDCSLIRMANLYANAAQIGDAEGLALCLEMVSGRAAKLVNARGHGLEIGGIANIVIFNGSDKAEAVAEIAQPLLGIRSGFRSFRCEPVQLRNA